MLDRWCTADKAIQALAKYRQPLHFGHVGRTHFRGLICVLGMVIELNNDSILQKLKRMYV